MAEEQYYKKYPIRTSFGLGGGICILISIALFWGNLLLQGFALLGISSFIFSLVCMDAMTYDGRRKIREKIAKQELQSLIQALPHADQIAILASEPIYVFDSNEIRRSLTISLTVVFFTLLSFSVFGSDLLIKENPMVELFSWVYLAVIAFYFGSRTIEKYAEAKK